MKTTNEMQLVPIGKLVPYVNNARTHSPEQINKLRSSLREFGFINPVIIDRSFGVIAGHGRILAAKEEGIEQVPCVFADHLTDAQKKAYIIADNRMAMDAGWDEELLRVEIEALQADDFDLALTGFDEKELAALFGDDSDAQEDDFDVDAELEKPCVAREDDIWHLGRHTVICGDSTKPETYAHLLGDTKVNLGMPEIEVISGLKKEIRQAMQCPGATRLAGFQSWKKFGRHVKKGEKGIKVIAPAPYKTTITVGKNDPHTLQPILGTDGKPVTEEKEVVVPRYKVVSTYDISQTEGKPLPEIASTLTGSVDSYDDFMAVLEQVSPVPIGFEDISGSAYGYYSPMEKRIAVREGLSEQQTLKTLVHEISHAKLHDFDLSKPRDEISKTDRQIMECQAEAVAFVCCERFGLDTSDYSFGYIAGWSSGRELKELRSSLEIIRDTAAEIIDGVESQLHELRQNREHEDEISSPVMAM